MLELSDVRVVVSAGSAVGESDAVIGSSARSQKVLFLICAIK